MNKIISFVLIIWMLCILWIICIFFNEGYIFYKISEQKKSFTAWEFQKILDLWNDVLQDNPAYLHNLGNTSYELYNPQEKNIETLETSLEYFKKSLSIWENEDTRVNHDIVASLLQEHRQTPEQEKEDAPEQEAEKQEQDDAESSKNSEDAQDSQAQNENQSQNGPQINQRDEEYKMQESEKLWELSPQEQNALEQKIEQLKQDQQYNQNVFNKKPQQGNFNNIFDMFFENQVWWEQKDW